MYGVQNGCKRLRNLHNADFPVDKLPRDIQPKGFPYFSSLSSANYSYLRFSFMGWNRIDWPKIS